MCDQLSRTVTSFFSPQDAYDILSAWEGARGNRGAGGGRRGLGVGAARVGAPGPLWLLGPFTAWVQVGLGGRQWPVWGICPLDRAVGGAGGICPLSRVPDGVEWAG
jgi:hypothetical protein